MFIVTMEFPKDVLSKLRCTECSIPDVRHSFWHIYYDARLERIVKYHALCPTCWAEHGQFLGRLVSRKELRKCEEITQLLAQSSDRYQNQLYVIQSLPNVG